MQIPGQGQRWSRTLTWTHLARTSAVAMAVLLVHATLFAQEEAGDTDGSAVTSSRGWVFEALIVAALFILALFVICRSSRRN